MRTLRAIAGTLLWCLWMGHMEEQIATWFSENGEEVLFHCRCCGRNYSATFMDTREYVDNQRTFQRWMGLD